MTTIEERLASYSIELDAAADLADARRATASPARRRRRHRVSSMRRWQTISIAAVTVAVIGGGLWAIASNRSSQRPAGPQPAVDTALPGSAAPWYRIADSDLIAQPVEEQPCCEQGAAAGPPFVEAWQGVGGPADELLVLSAFAPEEAGGAQAGPDATLLNQPDGSVWQFWSYGMTADRRSQLAGLVTQGSGLPFVLPEPSMSLLSLGGLGSGGYTRAQTYFASGSGEAGTELSKFATISVGSDRGLFRGLAGSLSITDTTVAGMPAWRAEDPEGDVTFAWRATAGQWATLTVGPALADRADLIAARVAPDQSELLPPGMAGTPAAASSSSSGSGALATELTAILTRLGWDATLREHQTRTTTEGIDVQWAYFSEPGRRLLVVSGPPDLLESVPDLTRHLSAPAGADPGERYLWPMETWLTTEAVITSTETVIVRSEGVDTNHAAHSQADLDSLLDAVVAA